MPLQQVRAALIALVTAASASWLMWGAAAASRPVAQILAPASGAKVRNGQQAPVTILVQGGDGLSWQLSLLGPGEDATMLASGAGAVAGATVAEIDPAALVAGQSYTLTLTATDSADGATAAATFTIPDPQYTLIPLESGNMSQTLNSTYAVDGPGRQIIFSAGVADPPPLDLLERQSGHRKQLSIPQDSNEGLKFSGDGTRLFYTGFFHEGGFLVEGLGYQDLASGTNVLFVDQAAYPFFTVAYAGQRVALQTFPPDRMTEQYFLYDRATNAMRQLTSDPAAIDFYSDCTAQLGTLPMITADGGTVVMITGATLGIVPADPSIGCRIFSYDVATLTLRQVAALPKSLYHVDIPALSGDGHWLSFPVMQPFGTEGAHGVSALLDTQSGTLSAPLVDAGSYTSFDSAVTRDGAGVIISTQADLDPRVGNADHNLELFYYDLATRQVTQITETTDGIGRTPRRCPPYRPSVSQDGSVLVFGFVRISGVEGCYLDGPQRNEADSFVFRFLRAVRKRPGNNGPVFDEVPGQRVAAGDTLTLDMTAHDPDGDPISFFAQEKGGTDVFPGSVITDHYDGTATFQWPTGPQDVGDHVLRVAAFDEGGAEVFHDITLSIVPGDATCAGDCNGDDVVTIGEVLTAVNIALGTVPLTTCPEADADGNGAVTIDDLLVAVGNALNGCPQATAAQGAVASRQSE
jgi:hypothetical protein